MTDVIMASGADVLRKAGAGVKNEISGASYTNEFIKQAESWINTATRENWSDSYSSLNDDIKEVLKEAVSNLAAIYMINYDMSGYSSRSEAEIMISVLKARLDEIIATLQDKKVETFMVGE